MKRAHCQILNALACVTMTAAAFSLSACGPKAFVPGTNTQHISAAGYLDVPPKVDILLSVDTVGNVANLFSLIEPDFASFVNGLEASRWDYRFVVQPITDQNTGNIPVDSTHPFAVSHYDGYYNSIPGAWIQPYPGAPVGPVNPAGKELTTAMFPTNYNGSSGVEPGLLSQKDFLNRSDIKNTDPTIGFIRTDATLAIITLSTGRDTSGAQWIPSNQVQYNYQTTHSPYQYTGTYQPVNETPIASLYNDIKQAKGGIASQIKYYSLVAQSSNCNGFNTWPGTRYAQMALAFNGLNMDICQNSLASMLNAVKQDLTVNSQPYKLLYAVLDAEPKAGTLKMTAVQNGSTVTYNELSSCGSSDGFVYIANQQPAVNTVVYVPTNTPMSPRSGRMIQLCGAAQLSGGDTADITYENAGSQASH